VRVLDIEVHSAGFQKWKAVVLDRDVIVGLAVFGAGCLRAIFSVSDYSLGLILVLWDFAVVEGTTGTAHHLICAVLATSSERGKFPPATQRLEKHYHFWSFALRI
jgi:hypothetical protein